MSETLDRLIVMANQIARNLVTRPDPAAVTADHIAAYWDPRMKALIFDHAQSGGDGLQPDALAAIAELRRRAL